jgi:hypothetical protein
MSMKDLPTINRFALIVEPDEGYLEWAKTCPDSDPNMTIKNLGPEGTVYLIPETEGDSWPWVRKNFLPVFEHELNAWYRDEAYWPKNRSFKEFQRFFRTRIDTVVFDMVPGSLRREP